MAGLYLHIPFCKQACYYCDFHFSTNQELKDKMVNAMLREMELQGNYLSGEWIETIYFGGGTPSVLSADETDKLLKKIRQRFEVSEQTEITLEANPDDLTPQKLKSFFELGINRLSIGIQSFRDDVLKFFNRAHRVQEGLQCFSDARNAGFSNITIDLIYGVPGQESEVWRENVVKALQLNPEHISAYALTIEPDTVFGRWQMKNKLQPLAEENTAEQFEMLMDILTGAGYEHYEISNFCKPGFQSKHNSSYWQQKKYLGIGPSAHSYDGNTRQFNIKNNALYIKALNEGRVPFEKEILSRESKINEYILTTLRTSWGCNVDYLAENFNHNPMLSHNNYLQNLIGQGLVEFDSPHLRLTRKGKLLADKIASDLFVD